MKTIKKLPNENRNHILQKYSAVIIFFGISIFVPIYMENGYLNLTQAKAHALYMTALLAAALWGASMPCARKNRTMAVGLKINILDFILIGFALNACLSSLLSQNVASSFFGNDGWSVGSAAILALTLSYFIISRYYKARANDWLPVLAANVIIFLITILHSMGIDIFGLHENVAPKQFYLYVSTIGNVNWLSGYLCIILPAFFIFIKSYHPAWGSYRGNIWNTSAELFRNFSFKDKLIGIGPELLGHYYDGLTSYGLIVLTAHNELLQWLLTTGILGSVLWGAVFLWLIISYFRSHCWEHGEIAFFLPLISYFGQSMLNSPNAMNIALFFLFLALFRQNASIRQ